MTTIIEMPTNGSRSYGICCCRRTTDKKWFWIEEDRMITACTLKCAEQVIQNLRDCMEAWKVQED